MTYEQYWYGDPGMVKAFREADKLYQERMNTEAWLQAMYVYDAITRATPLEMILVDGKTVKRDKYIPEPYPLFKEKETPDEVEDREEQERLQAELYMRQMMRVGKNWGKGGA